ncbi:hypothetical protein BRD09_00405 [Halobacteriales archaeon SW_10_68_16]|jgi:hypothetical protein|nr:MAG: hypothetical protein BRD09_00405 [Halobacteriales archaeon SW_10_68_16]
MSATVEITEGDGVYTAVDSETGATGRGGSRAMALAALAVQLQGLDEEMADELDPTTTLKVLSGSVQERFEDEDVSEEDVEDAIAWARRG